MRYFKRKLPVLVATALVLLWGFGVSLFSDAAGQPPPGSALSAPSSPCVLSGDAVL